MLDTMAGVWTHERLKVKEWKGEDVTFVQPKADGWGITFFMQPDPANGLCVFGRKHEAHLEYSHLLERYPWYDCAQRFLWERPRTSIVGELWAPGCPASSVVTAMKEGWKNLLFTPFAVPYWYGEPNTAGLLDTCNTLRKYGLTPAETRYWDSFDGVDDAMRWAVEEHSAEGIVLKQDHYAGWFKVKGEHTVDLVATDIKAGATNGKYIGEAGSLHGSLWRAGELVEVACCSGMDDDARRQITRADLGRVFEAKYQYLGAGGRLRHPRFLRWRDDKPAAECTWEQLNDCKPGQGPTPIGGDAGARDADPKG